MTSEKRGLFSESKGGGLSLEEHRSFKLEDKAEGNVLS